MKTHVFLQKNIKKQKFKQSLETWDRKRIGRGSAACGRRATRHDAAAGCATMALPRHRGTWSGAHQLRYHGLLFYGQRFPV